MLLLLLLACIYFNLIILYQALKYNKLLNKIREIEKSFEKEIEVI